MNPYAEFVAPQPEGAPVGNPYGQYLAAPVVDEAEQDVIGRTNNPNKETPESFGFAEIAPSVARGFVSDILSFPQAIGGNIVQQGESIQGKSQEDIAASGLIDILEGGNVFSSFGKILKLEKDLLVGGVASPQEIVNAGNSMVTSNQAVLEKAGLVRPEEGLGKYGFDIGQGLSSVGKSVALTVITKNPSYAAAMQGFIVNSADYREARRAGKTPSEAGYIAFTSASGQAALEQFGGKYFLSAATASPFLKKVIVRAAGQGAEEGTQSAWEASVKNATGVRNQSWGEVLSDIGYSSALGFIVGAPVSAVAGRFEKSAVAAGIPEAAAKKMAAEFVKNKDDIVSATAQLLHNEASGVAVDKNLVEEARRALVTEVELAEIQQPEINTEPFLLEAENIKKSLNTGAYDRNNPASLKGRIGYTPESIVQFIKRTGKMVDADGELAARDITPQKVRGLFKSGAQQAESLFPDGTARPGIDALKERLFDAGYFSGREDYNQITDSEVYDAIADDVSGQRVYTEEDSIKIEEILANDSAKYDAVGIDKNSRIEDIARVLANEAAKTAPARVTQADANDPRFNGELDLAKSTGKFSEDPVDPEADRERKFYQAVLDADTKDKWYEGVKDFVAATPAWFGKGLAPVSTRIRNINKSLENRLNRFEQEYRLQIVSDKTAITPFLEKFDALNETDKRVLDVAMKNGDTNKINEIAEANNMVADLAAVRKTLDGIYARAKAVGLDVGFRKNFFPRTIKNSKKFLAHFNNSEVGEDIAAAIIQKEMEIGRPFTADEKAHLVNTLLRGYTSAGITLSKPTALKMRSIDQVTPDILKFYHPASHSLVQYVTTVNQSIEARKFFGKSQSSVDATNERIAELELELAKVDEAIDSEDNKDLLKVYRRERSNINKELDSLIVDENKFFRKTKDMEDSIGAWVMDEIAGGRLNGVQAAELSDMLKARFNEGQMNAALRIYKNLSMIDTMGSFISTITQLNGVAYSLSDNGFYNTASALFSKKKIKIEDLGVAEEMSQEFTEAGKSGKLVSFVFAKNGLRIIDQLDKETFINSTLKRYERLAKSNPEKLRKIIEPTLENETQAAIDALREGRTNSSILFLMFTDLLQKQPIAKSQMPEMYLRHPNARILYMLKTFTIKQYDVYRRQVFDEIAAGNTVTGLRNLTRLAFFMSLMGAGTDMIKDLLLGKETEPDELVLNNIMRLFGFSNYQVYSVYRDGLGSTIKNAVTPPTKLADTVVKDVIDVSSGDKDIADIKSAKSVPILGVPYYWWFGAGSEE